MKWAITPYGVGQPVGARFIRDNWPLVDGETFTVPEGAYSSGMVLAADGRSLDPAPAPVAPDAIDAVDIVLLKVAFNHENRLRAIEGKAAITMAQFKTAVKALL